MTTTPRYRLAQNPEGPRNGLFDRVGISGRLGWVRPGMELVYRPSNSASDCLSWNRRSCLSVQCRLVRACPRIAEQIASAFGIDDAVITPAEREQRKQVHESAKAANLARRTASKQLTPDELNTFTRHIENCVERYPIKKQ